MLEILNGFLYGRGGEPEMTIRMANPSRSGGHSAVLDTLGWCYSYMDILDGSESGHDDGILSKTVFISQFDEH